MVWVKQMCYSDINHPTLLYSIYHTQYYTLQGNGQTLYQIPDGVEASGSVQNKTLLGGGGSEFERLLLG